jgi:hypothetical protein
MKNSRYKGIEHFDYLMKTQSETLVNNEQLLDSFLLMYDRLGLLYDENEKQIVLKNIGGSIIVRNSLCG